VVAWLLVSCGLIPVCWSKSEAASPTASELLTSFNEHLARQRRFTCRALEKCYIVHDSKYNPGHLFREAEFRVWVDGDVRKEWSSLKTHSLQKKNLTTNAAASERLVRPGRMLWINLDPITLKANGASAAIAPLSAEDQRLNLEPYIPFMTGRLLEESVPLAKIFAAGKLSFRPSRLMEREVIILHCESEWGMHSIWLDPARGYAPLRIEAKKSREHKGYDGRLLMDLPIDSGGPYEESEVIAAASSVKQVQGRWVVADYSIDVSYVYGKMKLMIHNRSFIRIQDIEFPESLPGAAVSDSAIPDGMPVTVFGQEMIKHEWRNGEVVKSIDGTVAAALEGAAFKPSAWPYWLFWAILSCLIAAGGAWWLIARSRAREASP
jgi:hypothetical protein